jgi:hypothetical protein
VTAPATPSRTAPAGRPPGLGRAALARAVAAAAAGTPGVAALVAGPGVPAVTHCPGGVVVGVALRGSAVSVHIRADRLPVVPVAGAVRDAVAAVLAAAGDPRQVQVVVEDITATELPPAPPASGGERS